MRAEHCRVAPPRLSFRTHELSEGALEGLALVDLLAGREDVSSWVHEERGLIGLGRTLVIEAHGAERIEALRAAWRAVRMSAPGSMRGTDSSDWAVPW